MGVPRTYRSMEERAIVSFDFFNFTNGLGYVEFFCFTTQDNTSRKYNILNDAIKSSSQSINLGAETVSVSYTTIFNQPKKIKGKILTQFHWGFRANGNTETIYATISLEKNGVEQVSARGQDLTSTGNTHRIEIIEMDTDLINFKKDDILKIKITFTQQTGANLGTWIAHDPLDQGFTPPTPWTGGALTDSKFKILIPFVVDL